MSHCRSEFALGAIQHLVVAMAAAAVVSCGTVTEAERDAAETEDPDAEAGGGDASGPADAAPSADAASDAPEDAGAAFPDDPELYLAFDDSIEDQSGNDHTVSASIGVPAFGTDRFGFGEKAVDLSENFQSDHDQAIATGELGLDGDITVAVWMLGQSFGNGERIAGQGDWYTLMFHASQKVGFGMVDGLQPDEPSVTDPGTHDANAWTFYAGVVEVSGGETTVTLYKDGDLVAEDTVTAIVPAPSCRFYIGNFDTSGNLCTDLDRPARLDALVDDVRVYDRALSAEEIALLYEEGGFSPD